MKISVVIPTYNRRHCILNAVNSVLRQKKVLKYEIIIIDDGSKDGTIELFKGMPVKYFWFHKNRGVNFARNRGVEKATGDYILFLDSDDELTDDAFETIKENEYKLLSINFLGVREKATKHKMYGLSHGTGYYSLEDLITKKARGEFLGLFKKHLFKIEKFDESFFCFEIFYTMKMLKDYVSLCYIIDKPCRIYSFEQTNRISNEFRTFKRVSQRFRDYKRFLKEFGPDYIKYEQYGSYFSILFKTVVFGVVHFARKLFR